MAQTRLIPVSSGAVCSTPLSTYTLRHASTELVSVAQTTLHAQHLLHLHGVLVNCSIRSLCPSYNPYTR
eukprot:1638751-Amphidinium_carterae.1